MELAGATVRKATLNNFGDIERKGVKLGCTVLIRRSNEVIPEILGAIDKGDGTALDIEKPKVCPYCGGEIKEYGANLFCVNRMCKPRIVQKISHFAQKNAMDIDGLSEMTATLLLDKLGIYRCSQLYSLKREDLLSLENYGDKKADHLLSSLKKSKACTLDKFIYALGIGGIGRVGARDLAKTYKSIDALMSATRDDLISLDNIGDITADAVCAWFKDEENLSEIQTFKACGIDPKMEEVQKQGVFLGERVVLTGTLQGFKRADAQKLIEENGGECQSSVGGKTTLVLAGEAAGSKLDKAKKMGIKIIDETEFKTMLGL